jgi:hypothetical protein
VSDYAAFLAGKRHLWTGRGVTPTDDPAWLWPFQRALRNWALQKGRAALFCDTGLGKTRMQVSWADQIPGRVLILAPLAVGEQTIREAQRVGITVGPVGSGARIEITNYERLHRVRPADFEREWLYADGYRYTLECGHKQNRSSRTMFRVRCRECDAVAHGWKAETARPEAQP